MDTAILREVIETQILRRGKGIEGDPVRVITQIWTTDGEFLAERDPFRIEECECHSMRSQNEHLKGALKDQQEYTTRLHDAIRWALGEGNSNFGENAPDDVKKKPYWWRTELRKRAGL